MNEALLAFSIAPVQDFIAAARTTRDLWAGSYLLSWLTAHAMRAVRDQDGRIVFPEVKDNPLYQAVEGQTLEGRIKLEALTPCLPNTFVAALPQGDPQVIADTCQGAVREEWAQICRCVRRGLDKSWREVCPDWDQYWDRQIGAFWEIRTTVLPAESLEIQRMQGLVGTEESNHSRLRRELLVRLAAARKTIRHYPPHEVDPDGPPDTRPKCSLLGTWAQMGPLTQGGLPQMAATTKFWNEVRRLVWPPLGKRDRLCAVSLVKRFAWHHYWAPRFGMKPQDHHYPDVHTIAAAQWLQKAQDDPDLGWNKPHERMPWSGLWLRWHQREDGREAGEDLPDETTWKRLEQAKKRIGQPPAYYAVLMLDGDHIGDATRKADDDQIRILSERLSTFAVQSVPAVVGRHHGTLVYAGGDDVLALLPTEAALSCAQELARVFPDNMRRSAAAPLTCSAALVVTHVMEDLRRVLDAAREAETQAKHTGRDCLALSIRRRSGAQPTVVCPWKLVPFLIDLSRALGEVSDRWTYHLAAESPAIEHLPRAALCSEIRRCIGRAGDMDRKTLEKLRIEKKFDEYCETMTDRGMLEWKVFRSFVTLCQSASFLVRNRSE